MGARAYLIALDAGEEIHEFQRAEHLSTAAERRPADARSSSSATLGAWTVRRLRVAAPVSLCSFSSRTRLAEAVHPSAQPPTRGRSTPPSRATGAWSPRRATTRLATSTRT